MQELQQQITDILNESTKVLSEKIYKQVLENLNDNSLKILSSEILNHKLVNNCISLDEFTDENGYLNVINYCKDEENMYLLLQVCSALGNLNIVRYIVEQNNDICISDAIRYSALNGHLEVVKYFVEKYTHRKYKRALLDSARNGHLEVVKYLVERYEIIEKSDVLSNAVHNSVMYGHLEVVKYLIEKGTDIKDSGFLETSVCRDKLEIVKYLAKKYKQQKLEIPSKAITKELNDINRVLFMYATSEQHDLFNPEIVETLCTVKTIVQ